MKRISLSILSGLILVLAFPPAGFGFAAWASVVPLFFAVEGAGKGRGFMLGFLSGFVFFIGTVYWVINSMYFYGGVPVWISVFVMLALAAYLSLYVAVFGLCLSIILERFSGILQIALAPSVWVALEYLRGYLLTGFPWVLLGYSQAYYTPLVQIADTTGVWGVSFLIISVNTALFLIMRHFLKKDSAFPLRELALALVLLAATAAYGLVRIGMVDRETPAWKGVTAGVAQGAIDQGVKWDRSFQKKTLDIYRELSVKASKAGAGFIVWPETAVPFYLGADSANDGAVEAAARDAGSYVLTGSPSYSYNLATGSPSYFNSAYLISPGGAIVGKYDKVHLVPFGEYVPLKRFLPFVKKLTAGVGDFSEGPGAMPIMYDGGGIGVLICFEAIFPDIARTSVKNGAGIIVNITNDGWFGRTSAPYQHLEMSVMRAVENKVYLLRSANTGISAVVDPAGRIMDSISLFEKGVMVDRVGFRKGPLTFYSMYGDIFAYGCLVFTGIFIFLAFKDRRYR
ncbi:MAG: apolipoprotein N-acyltransferase [Deltaproteobacteria bacterium]|nr:apolipoprotein N-acyltransferase [Deltaproteobacteria bacterium]